jgi:ATP-binding cassette, subfamily F, member 3
MSILTTTQLGLSFGAFDLFQNISVRIARDSKIGLIGPNGVGKTSLLLILAGLNAPTVGSISLARGLRLGYLRQEAVEAFAARDNTVYAEMLTVFAPVQALQARLQAMETEMATGDHSTETLDKYGALQEAFEHAGGYEYEVRIQSTLAGLGLDRSHWEKPLCQLSGGQQTRALLARLLLEKPDLLMLDEPTNHLDAEAVEWLEHTLREWDGAVLVASHDRYFLDNVVNTIWEMGSAEIEVYAGNYSAYLLQRDERWEYAQRVFEEEKARLLGEVDFIQRNWVRASTHAQALGRLRRVSRDIAAIETYGIQVLRSGLKWSELDLRVNRPLDVVEAIRRVNALRMPGRPPHLRPRLAAAHTSGNIILRTKDLRVGYPEHALFAVSELELMRGECAALIGPNGSGKTTFLKTLLGQLAPLGGQVQLGAALKVGYFAQAHDTLDPNQTVLDELQRHAHLQPEQARSYLAQYLFRGEDVYKPVRALSGGERGRLALAIVAWEKPNFLLLDEPTNHLDLPAQEALQEVLAGFTGTILLVSHDRYLIDRLATQIWELRSERLRVFKGTYREFVLQSTSPSAAPRQILLPAKPLARDNSRDTRQRQQALALLETRIRDEELAVQRLAGELQRLGEKKAFEQARELSWKFAQAQARLEQLTTEWESLAA